VVTGWQWKYQTVNITQAIDILKALQGADSDPQIEPIYCLALILPPIFTLSMRGMEQFNQINSKY
jgi:hypothetical protein